MNGVALGVSPKSPRTADEPAWVFFAVRDAGRHTSRLTETVREQIGAEHDVTVALSARGIAIKGRPHDVLRAKPVVDALVDGDAGTRAKRAVAKAPAKVTTYLRTIDHSVVGAIIGVHGNVLRNLVKKAGATRAFYENAKRRFVVTASNAQRCTACERLIHRRAETIAHGYGGLKAASITPVARQTRRLTRRSRARRDPTPQNPGFRQNERK